ncbi:unnamed protein product [Choristocarpus tenellus]
MAGSGGVWVFYFVQGEGGESVDHPNAFNVKDAKSEVRYGQFLNSFPLRTNGRYHFRFRAPDRISGYSWVDLSDPTAVLPRYDDIVCAKALRLDNLPRSRPSRLRRKGVGQVKSRPGGRGPLPHIQTKEFVQTATEHEDSTKHSQGQGRARSASPAMHHHGVHHTPRHDGLKSSTPPGSSERGAGGGGGVEPGGVGVAGGMHGQSRQQTENLESFLFSESPPNSTTSSSSTRRQVRSGDEVKGGSGGDLLNFDQEQDASGSGNAQQARTRNGEKGLNHWGVRVPPPPPPVGSPTSAAPLCTAGTMGGIGMGGVGGPANVGTTRPSVVANKNSSGAPPGYATPGKDLMDVIGGRDAANGVGTGEKVAKSAYVRAKMEERERKLAEDTQKAVQFKKDIDAAALKEQDEMDAARVKHDATLTVWSEDHGKKRNIRTLLSTMHTVLWEGCRWKQTSMGDLIQPSKVKMAYRKAMLVVHPDKCTDLNSEGRLIAKRVFEAVNEAYAVFSAKEMAT